MKLFITKASDNNYTDIISMSDIPTLYKKYGRFIIKRNNWKDKKIEMIALCWNVSTEKAKEISECEFQLVIYDYWIE